MNSEFEVLYDFLEKLPDVLVPGGRAAILTFHSGEDRLVKKLFKRLKKEGIYQEIFRRGYTSFRRRMCEKQPGTVDENAVGH